MFWTTGTTDRIVRGPVDVALDDFGGSADALGVPVEDEAYRGKVVPRKLDG